MLKKFFKIMLWAGGILAILIIAAYIFVRIKYPPDEIKNILIHQTESALDRRVTIGDLWLHPLKGFTINDVRIYDSPAADSIHGESAYLMTAAHLQLRYRLLSLLRKRIQIQEIIVDRPEVYLSQNEKQVWNFESLVPIDTKVSVEAPAPVSKDTTAEFSLPFSVKLKKLAVNDVAAHVRIYQPQAAIDVKTGGLSVHLNDVSASLKSMDELMRDMKASLSLFSNDQPWEVEIQSDSSEGSFRLSSILELNLNTEVSGTENIVAKGNIALTNTNVQFPSDESGRSAVREFPLPELIGISLSVQANTETQNIDLNDLTAKLCNETLFSVKGNAAHFLEAPEIFAEVIESEIRLEQVLDSFLPMLPDSIAQEFLKIKLAGAVSLKGTHFRGHPMSESSSEGLDYALNFAMKNISAGYAEPEATVKNLNVTSTARGMFNAVGFHGAEVNFNFGVDSLGLSVDTLSYAFEGLAANAYAHLDSKFFPDSVKSTITIEDFFKTKLSLAANFASFDRLHKYLANIHLSFDEVSLAAVTQSQMEGDVGLDLKISSQSTDSIRLALNIASDILEIPFGEEPIIVYPMDFMCDAVLGTDTTFQQFDVKMFDLQVSDFLSLAMHGRARLGETQSVEAEIENIELNHQNALMIVPEQFLVGLESLELSGNTTLNSKVSVQIDEKAEPKIFAAGSVVMDAGIHFPGQFFYLGSMKNKIDFETDAKSGKIQLQSELDSLFLAGVLENPLFDISLNLTGNAPDFETVNLDSARIQIPAFSAEALVTGSADSLAGTMRANLKSQVIVNATDKRVTFPGNISVDGKITQRTAINLTEQMADVDGWLQFDNFSLQYDTLAHLDTIAGKILFTQQFDIEKGEIIEKQNLHSFMASTSSSYYDLLRPYYFRDANEKFSRLSIKQIKALDYFANDMTIDIFIQNQRIEIPRFSLKLYDGNMAGMISVNAHTGLPDDIEWKIKADLSRLNSAKLLPSGRGAEKDSDLNLNLELQGQGVDPASRLDVGGYFYVTKIGPQFTDNVLQSLDPKGIDKSIQDTRTLLNWGYKPKLISFEIKHDNLYPTIHLVKGKLLTKLIPLNLAGGNKIELSRIPVKFFLSNMAATTN